MTVGTPGRLQEGWNDRTYRTAIDTLSYYQDTKLILRCEHEQLLHTECKVILSSMVLATRSQKYVTGRVSKMYTVQPGGTQGYRLPDGPTTSIKNASSSILFQYGCELRRAVLHQGTGPK